MPFVDVSGESIFFTLSCDAPDPALLAVHGSGGDHTHWPPEFRDLARRAVYTIDLPGHGRSAGYGRDSVEAYADFIEKMVSRLRRRRVIVAGHSLGGAIAQELALRSPSWMCAAILVGTGARLKVTPEILDGLKADPVAAVQRICDRAYGPAATAAMIDAGCRALLDTPWTVLHGDYCACNRFDVMNRVSAIRLPTLILSGDSDRLTPPKYGDYLQGQIPGSHHVVLKPAGHMLMLEQPRAFVEAVSAFLARIDGGGRC
jgi:pimeloyl-ACP methyl ester carboxylesterase